MRRDASATRNFKSSTFAKTTEQASARKGKQNEAERQVKMIASNGRQRNPRRSRAELGQ